ncbi:MAG TPA: hypothetical protein VKT82_28945 [Ktedonobacterales bacterium]|nr:hypothetical protein [Ktedonobacterales bacterium]
MALTSGDLQAIGELFDRKFDEKIEDKIRPLVREEIHASESLLREDMKASLTELHEEMKAGNVKVVKEVTEVITGLMDATSELEKRIEHLEHPKHN